MKNHSAKEGKTTAIISHFWVIGLIIAFIMNNSKNNYFASFYIRQMVGLNLIQVLNGWIVYKFLGPTAGAVVGFIVFAFWVISLIGVIKEEEKLVPFVGDKFQDWFKNI